MTKKDISQLKEDILKKISDGEVTMKPKYQFVLLSAVYVFGIVLAVLLLFYLMSFLAFFVRVHSLEHTTEFGLYGLKVYMLSLPWLIVAVIGVLIIITEMLFRHFAFSYRKPVLYSLLGLLLVVCCGSYILAKTPLHSVIHSRVIAEPYPIATPLYERYTEEETFAMERGLVRAIQDAQVELQKPNRDIIFVVTSTATMFRNGRSIERGDVIMVIGEKDANIIAAKGVYVFPKNDKFAEERFPGNRMERLERLENPQKPLYRLELQERVTQ